MKLDLACWPLGRWWPFHFIRSNRGGFMLKFANCNLWLALGLCILTGRVSAQIQVREVVSEGQAAPGAAAGETFLTLRETIINDAGNIAFGADLTGPNVVSDVNARGIW